jgi:hypothetical protein
VTKTVVWEGGGKEVTYARKLESEANDAICTATPVCVCVCLCPRALAPHLSPPYPVRRCFIRSSSCTWPQVSALLVSVSSSRLSCKSMREEKKRGWKKQDKGAAFLAATVDVAYRSFVVCRGWLFRKTTKETALFLSLPTHTHAALSPLFIDCVCVSMPLCGATACVCQKTR